MNEKEFLDFIATPEGSALLEKQKSGLVAKNTELLAEIRTLNGRLTEATERASGAAEQLEAERRAVAAMAIDKALEHKLESLKAKPETLKAAILQLKTEHNFTVKADGDDRRGIVTDADGNEIPLDEFAENWANSESGKGFILNGNSGGGATGSTGSFNDSDSVAFRQAMGLKS